MRLFEEKEERILEECVFLCEYLKYKNIFIVEYLFENKFLRSIDLVFAKSCQVYCKEKGFNFSNEAFGFAVFVFSMMALGHVSISIKDFLIEQTLKDELLKGELDFLKENLSDFLVEKEGFWYLPAIAIWENCLVENCLRVFTDTPDLKVDLNVLEHCLLNYSFNKEQKNVVRGVFSRSLSFICGGPGTGKTYVALALLKIFIQLFPDALITVCAQTGKATALFRELCKDLNKRIEVKTLHSLFKNGTTQFFTKIFSDLIVVDEGSMVDAQRMAFLFASIKKGARVVIIGDKNQLPPVENGNFFVDMLSSCREAVFSLTSCVRTENNDVLEIISKIKNGESIEVEAMPSVEDFADLVLERFCNAYSDISVLDSNCLYNRIGVLTPLKKGKYGSDYLNAIIFEKHTKRAKIKGGLLILPIMISCNDSQLNLFNGDAGFLFVNEKKAWFPRIGYISQFLLPAYQKAYVISVHKSQGSEYNNVVLILPKGSFVFGKEMLYTAVTRAKEKVEIYANAKELELTLKGVKKRNSCFEKLFEQLRQNMN